MGEADYDVAGEGEHISAYSFFIVKKQSHFDARSHSSSLQTEEFQCRPQNANDDAHRRLRSSHPISLGSQAIPYQISASLTLFHSSIP